VLYLVVPRLEDRAPERDRLLIPEDALDVETADECLAGLVDGRPADARVVVDVADDPFLA